MQQFSTHHTSQPFHGANIHWRKMTENSNKMIFNILFVWLKYTQSYPANCFHLVQIVVPPKLQARNVIKYIVWCQRCARGGERAHLRFDAVYFSTIDLFSSQAFTSSFICSSFYEGFIPFNAILYWTYAVCLIWCNYFCAF